jgi:uncharacterized protein with HEPN domain
MKKQIVIDKIVYGGMLVEKYFLVLDDGMDFQVPYREWELYQKGDEYPKRLPASFNQATNDIEEDKITNQDWKKMHDMQQKLVVDYVLENEKLKELEHYKIKYNNIIEAIKNCHKAKNRYHSQIAWAKLFELANLPAEYPENYERK